MRVRRTPQRVAARREQILDTARRLFDADGTAAVSTARIAREAGISPGNLYYWFPDKADIVRALYEQWSVRSEPPIDQNRTADEILQTLWWAGRRQATVTTEFVFFSRELFTLLHADPTLRSMYRANFERRLALFEAIGESVIGDGLIRRPDPPSSVRDVITQLWLVAETAVPFADAVGRDLFDPHRAHTAIIEPLLTERGRLALGLPPQGEWT
ncbi:TetR/AcrR family transcriptional regulator [Gordonia sp. VNQ95]|uniref:TetR/AcrR family transcriptional regulator n=1 Tax=Gordonia sp. VNQ95 TaxID=3156619 RepID=UPI0032B40669